MQSTDMTLSYSRIYHSLGTFSPPHVSQWLTSFSFSLQGNSRNSQHISLTFWQYSVTLNANASVLLLLLFPALRLRRNNCSKLSVTLDPGSSSSPSWSCSSSVFLRVGSVTNPDDCLWRRCRGMFSKTRGKVLNLQNIFLNYTMKNKDGMINHFRIFYVNLKKIFGDATGITLKFILGA